MTKLSDFIQTHSRYPKLKNIGEQLRFFTLALCGEAGELANKVKKDWRGDPGDRSKEIISELADVLNYSYMIADILGVSPEEIMLQKFEEVSKRPEWQDRQ